MKSLMRKYQPLKPAFWENREEDVDVFEILKEAHSIISEEYDSKKLLEEGWSETIIKTADCFNSAAVTVKPLDLFYMSLKKQYDVETFSHRLDNLVARPLIKWIRRGNPDGPNYLITIPKLIAQMAGNFYFIYVPFVLYWIVSFIFPLKLDGSVLGRRLSRTLMAFGGIIALNYVSVGLERAREWLKTLPDLN